MKRTNEKVMSYEQLDEYKIRLLKICGKYQKHILATISRIKANCLIEYSDSFCKACEAVIIKDIEHIEECFGEVLRLDALYGERCELDKTCELYEDDLISSFESECKRETACHFDRL